ncbi:MAG: glycolate oxidase subunit GlcE [Alphaproteobacteria bacterium]
MPETWRPENADQVTEAVRWAVGEETPVDLLGAGSKAGLGYPGQAAHRIDLSGLAGINLYEPDELVLSAMAGTPLAEIEGLLRQNRQQLAFEPPDFGPLYGGAPDKQTLGGVLAANLAGPRRIKAGAARDHFLGVHAVTGRGELIKSGGRVVKNVTGYDLCKLLAGSHGTLAAMTEVTVKVLPAPEKTRTVLVFGLDDETAVRALSQAGGSPHEVSGLAHLPPEAAARSAVGYVRDAGAAVTAIRVEGPGPSVEHRCNALKTELGGFGAVEELHSHNTAALWREIRDVKPLLGLDGTALWKLSVTPMRGPAMLANLPGARLYDWAGGLIWLAAPPDTDGQAIRAAIGAEGHATLVRADDAVRQAATIFQPQPEALAALTARVKNSFDPHRVLNRGRMYREL